MKQIILTLSSLLFLSSSFANDFSPKDIATAYTKISENSQSDDAQNRLSCLDQVKELATKVDKPLLVVTDHYVQLLKDMQNDKGTRIIVDAIIKTESDSNKIDLLYDAKDLLPEINKYSSFKSSVLADTFPTIVKAVEVSDSAETALDIFVQIAAVELKNFPNDYTYDIPTDNNDTRASVIELLKAYRAIFGLPAE